jgi:hypothetical protein
MEKAEKVRIRFSQPKGFKDDPSGVRRGIFPAIRVAGHAVKGFTSAL